MTTKPTTHRGTTYWPTRSGAKLYAEAHGYSTDRIIEYRRGFAIQTRISGHYVDATATIIEAVTE